MTIPQNVHAIFPEHSTKRVEIPIFIDFQNGEDPTDVQAVFDMLFCPQFGVDLSTLREVVSKYYNQWNQKKLPHTTEPEGLFSNFSSAEMTMEPVGTDMSEVYGYDREAFTSMTDFFCFEDDSEERIKFPCFTSGDLIDSERDENSVERSRV